MIEFDLSLFFLVGGLYLEELINGGAYFQNFPLLASHFCRQQITQNISHGRAFIPGKFMRARSEKGIELNCKESKNGLQIFVIPPNSSIYCD